MISVAKKLRLSATLKPLVLNLSDGAPLDVVLSSLSHLNVKTPSLTERNNFHSI